jgi:DNA mismatch repair protein MutL
MSDVIQLLPDTVANQIAAGEVIQRPASVIKELVENAVDAGAQHINVLVVDAGRTSIQVIDDGKGMSETDARLSFERHATSKIRMADDLFNLHTMGFRGEALASIAAVSHIELKTRTNGEDIGTQLSIAGSKFAGQEPCACPVGSNFKVDNLFYNVPARRKFLKSNTTELNHIITAFERIALVYPNIAFTFHSNGSEMYNLRAGGLRQRIVDIFGKRINQDLLPVNVETSVCGVGGFVGKPESAKKRGVSQYFFVNGRYMRHPYFHKAVMQVFERLIPQGTQVPYFLYFDVDPKDIDVNIHPTKTEIKFENEQAIWQILFASIKDAIGRFNDITTIDFDTEGKPDIPVFDSEQNTQLPKMNLTPQYNPFNSNESSHEHRSKVTGGLDEAPIVRSQVPEQWEQLYEGLKTESAPVGGSLFTGSGDIGGSLIDEKSPSHYQYKGKYIMTAVKSGLMIIDQHCAHVRMLFEQYRKQLAARKIHSQKVLFPETIELSVQEDTIFQSVREEIKSMGFELSDLGGNTYAVYAIPEGFEGIDMLQLLHDMIGSVQEKGVADVDAINDSLALSMARAAAVPYGQVLSNEEMEGIINGLFICSNVNYTPDGKTILYILKQEEMEQMLG